MPDAFAVLKTIAAALETHYRDMQDIEFTVERGKLWILQTRTGKRTVKAALKIAGDMAQAGLISREEAVMRIDPAALEQLLHPVVDSRAEPVVLAAGLPAAPGAAAGEIVFSADEAVRMAAQGRKVILVRAETSPQDIHGIYAAEGILTLRGGMTSHAAVIARGMGKPCVCGAGAVCLLRGDEAMKVAGMVFKKGNVITLDGDTGEVMQGVVPCIKPELPPGFACIMQWADDIRRLKVRAIADTPGDARLARALGAEGIGLCRTGHMLCEGVRLNSMVQAGLLSADRDGCQCMLAKLFSVQKTDFLALFEIMSGLPVAIRLLDVALQEAALGADFQLCGLAGDSAAVVKMQLRAIFEAVIEAADKTGFAVIPEIMARAEENRAALDAVKTHADAVAQAVMQEKGRRIVYRVGAMIDMQEQGAPGQAMTDIADFFSFNAPGSAGLAFFHSLRRTQTDPKFGICNEDGMDPSLIGFCEQARADYVTCAPLLIPVIRLAAAQAALESALPGKAMSS